MVAWLARGDGGMAVYGRTNARPWHGSCDLCESEGVICERVMVLCCGMCGMRVRLVVCEGVCVGHTVWLLKSY